MLSLEERCGRRSFTPYMKRRGFVYPCLELHQDTELRLNLSCVASKIKNEKMENAHFLRGMPELLH